MRVNIEDKYSVLPAGSSMAEFSQKQIEQLKELFGTPLNLLSRQIGVLSQSSDQMSQQIGVLSQSYGELSQSSDQMGQQIGVLSQSSDQMSQQIGVLSQRYGEMSQQIDKRFGHMSKQIGAINERQIRQERCMCADMQNHHAPYTPAERRLLNCMARHSPATGSSCR